MKEVHHESLCPYYITARPRCVVQSWPVWGRLPGPSKRRASLSRSARRGAFGRSIFGFAAVLLSVLGIRSLAFIRARVVVLRNPVYSTFKKLHLHRRRPPDPSQGPQRCPLAPAPPGVTDPPRQRVFPLADRKPPAAKKARPNLDRPFRLGFIHSALLLAGSGPSVRPFWPLPFVLPSFPGIRLRVPLRCRCGSMRSSRCHARPAQK